MKTKRFSKFARKVLIQAVEQHHGVQLKRVKGFDRWLLDESGRNWWVLGGELFHGISEKMMHDEYKSKSGGKIVVGLWEDNKRIKAFAGSICPLIKVRNQFKAGDGDYKLNFKEKGSDLVLYNSNRSHIRTSVLVLGLFSIIPYSAEDLKQDKQLSEAKKIVDRCNLSSEEIQQIMNKLS